MQMPKNEAELQALLEAAKKAGKAEAKGAPARLTLKIGAEKKALSVYGLGRFPVTLYGAQWLRLLEITPEIKTFITEHRNDLAWKEDSTS